MTMTLIETKTLTATATSIEFASIPQTFTDLQLTIAARTNADSGPIFLSLNTEVINFSRSSLAGFGANPKNPPQGSTISDRFIGLVPTSDSRNNSFSNIFLCFINYTSSDAKAYFSNVTTEQNSTTDFDIIVNGMWNDTAAITSVKIERTSEVFVIGSTVSLYGITKGSSGGVTTS